jgi:hypothetical protein
MYPVSRQVTREAAGIFARASVPHYCVQRNTEPVALSPASPVASRLGLSLRRSASGGDINLLASVLGEAAKVREGHRQARERRRLAGHSLHQLPRRPAPFELTSNSWACNRLCDRGAVRHACIDARVNRSTSATLGWISTRRGGRAVECGGLENRYPSFGGSRVQIPPPPLSRPVGDPGYAVAGSSETPRRATSYVRA